MADLDQLRLDAIYSVLATDAVVTPNVGGPQSLRAIDKTAGVQIDDSSVSVYSVVPGCFLRSIELAALGIGREDLDGGTVELNGATWDIISTAPRPGMNGEASGEVRLILQETGSSA